MTSTGRRDEPRTPGRHRASDTRPARWSRTNPPGRSGGPVRIVLATGLAGCLGFVALLETRAAGTEQDRPVPVDALHERAEAATGQHASRGERRTAPPAAPTAAPTPGVATPTPTPTSVPTRPPRPRPVAGLTQAQMDNARVIVEVGQRLKVPRKGLVVAVATAMQESNLYNLASGVLPESTNYPHQGVGWDHDSVGLFQQRTSSGWGPVRDLMRPAYAAEKFYRALLQVPGWQGLSLAAAAQAVQVSAFPDAYARHESRAETIFAALL